MQAETAPLHRCVGEVVSEVNALKTSSDLNIERIRRLEVQMTAGSSGDARPEPHDPARRRVHFIGSGNQNSVDARIIAMEGVMKMHFPEMRPSCINLFPDKAGRASVNGYVELGSPTQVRIITEQVRALSLQVDCHKGVKIKSALMEIDRNRNWALLKAEELIKASPCSHAKNVTVKRGDKVGAVRGVYVDDSVAFSQAQSFARGGTFHCTFADLQLP